MILQRKSDPIDFTYVLATGGVSLILKTAGWNILSAVFLILACSCFISLIVLFGVRGFLYKKMDNLFEYLTFGASTNILALCFAARGYDFVGAVLGILGTITIVFLIYAIFCVCFFYQKSAIELISPQWMIMGIACHTVSMLIMTLWQHAMLSHPGFLLFAFCFWSFGILLYLFLMTLNLYRMFFLPFEGRDVRPSYWMCLGAAAIAAVDGSRLVLIDQLPLFLAALKPFIEGMVFLFWGWGTAWIPLLILILIFQYTYYKMPIRYQSEQWAIVFALSMHTVVMEIFASQFNLEILRNIIPIWMWTSIFCWCVIALMIGLDFRRSLRRM